MSKTITRTCEVCQKQFTVFVKNLKGDLVRYGRYCSPKCTAIGNKPRRVLVHCKTCNKELMKRPSEIRNTKSGFLFCSKSCAAKYNNTHKTHGTKRSKLEVYLESRLQSEFPNLIFVCNDRNEIGIELDFYFPQLRLAIELNGIFHYEPIYGTDKLEQIQANDLQKYANCLAAGIELCVIDTSAVNNVTGAVKERYWSIIKDLVVPLLGRADNTNVPVP